MELSYEPIPKEQELLELDASLSAQGAVTRMKILVVLSLFAVLLICVDMGQHFLVQAIIESGTLLYLLNTFYLLVVAVKGYSHQPSLTPHLQELLVGLNDHVDRLVEHIHFPVYSVLCPVYKEVKILPQLRDMLIALRYPKSRLNVQWLVEVDDVKVLKFLETFELPEFIRITIVPKGEVRTKPNACIWGLQHVDPLSKFLVIYDAEDIADPLQLLKSILAFHFGGEKLACVQARLTFYNPKANLQTRAFYLEYLTWFGLMLPGLDEVGGAKPLGGTSNHFRTDILRKAGGWDKYNVAEDADLGIRLQKLGYSIGLIDSETEEEPNAGALSWIKQRTRWKKGYLQTFIVHLRNPLQTWKTLGPGYFMSFFVVIGLSWILPLVNPLYWGLFILYVTGHFVHQIQGVFPSWVLTPALVSMLDMLCRAYYMQAAIKLQERHGKPDWSFAPMILIMWFTYYPWETVATYRALYQLIFKPYYWDKTEHKHAKHTPQLEILMGGN